MSIERLTHLRFAPDTALPTLTSTVAGADAGAAKAGGQRASRGGGLGPDVPRLTAKVPTLSDRIAATPVATSVVVTIQSAQDADATAAEPMVYGDPRKSAVQADAPDAAETAAPRQADFVSVAVSAMREYSDEVERQKRYAQIALTAQNAAPPAIETTSTRTATDSSTPLRGLQQLAARFNLFA
jgi:hypothetical protein